MENSIRKEIIKHTFTTSMYILNLKKKNNNILRLIGKTKLFDPKVT
jgi:hypothetical protein